MFQPADFKICQVLEEIGLLHLREYVYTVMTDIDFRVRLSGFRVYMPCIYMILGKLVNFPFLDIFICKMEVEIISISFFVMGIKLTILK